MGYIKIEGLQRYLDAQKVASEGRTTSGVSARGGVDIRPIVAEIFLEKDNQPMKVVDIVSAISSKRPEIEKEIIEKKMVHVKRTFLVKTGAYGMYHLPPEEYSPEMVTPVMENI